jgi:hypothetical protein
VSSDAASRALLGGLFLWPGRGGDEVIVEANLRGFRLDRAGSEQNLLAPLRVGQLLAQRRARARHPVDGRTGETSLPDLLLPAIRRMDIRVGEEPQPADRIQIEVLPVC